jgi:hypothetical protein
MITMAELEDRREETKRRIEELRQINKAYEGLTPAQKDEFDRLRETLDIIDFNLTRHNEMTEYLAQAEPFGGPQ